jgi:hypothetical protein
MTKIRAAIEAASEGNAAIKREGVAKQEENATNKA